MKAPAFQFYANDFLGSTAEFTAEEVGIYIRLLAYQWINGGLDPSRVGFLAGQASAESLKLVLSRKFQSGEDGLLRNPKLEEVRSNRKVFCEKQKGNAGKRWHQSGISLESTWHQSGNAKPMLFSLQSSSSIEERERGAEEIKGNCVEIPPITRQEFDALAEMRGVPKDCAEWFWNTHDARNWLDARGQPIRRVEPLLLNVLRSWRSSGANPRQSTGTGTAELILRQKEYERVTAEMHRIKSTYGDHQSWSDEDRTRYNALLERKKQLKAQLGVIA